MSIVTDDQTKILSRVRALVERGERVPTVDVAALFAVTDTTALARIARIPRERRHGRSAYFTDVARVEYTGQPVETILASIGETASAIALEPIGSVDPEGLAAAAGTIARTHEVALAMTPARIERAARTIGITHADVLGNLLASAPTVVTADGAELFDDAFRARLAPQAITTDAWVAAHRAAHALGIRSAAAMTYLTQEAPGAYAAHLDRLRSLQDETGGFAQFVPLPVHNRHREPSYLASPSAHQSLRMIAIARIALDNFEHIGAPAALVTPEVAVIALGYGADLVDTLAHAGSVGLREGAPPESVELPVVGEAGAPRGVDGAHIASRLVEARFVPTAIGATLAPRTVRVTA